MAQEHAFSLAVENLLQCVIPLRASIIRIYFVKLREY